MLNSYLKYIQEDTSKVLNHLKDNSYLYGAGISMSIFVLPALYKKWKEKRDQAKTPEERSKYSKKMKDVKEKMKKK